METKFLKLTLYLTIPVTFQATKMAGGTYLDMKKEKALVEYALYMEVNATPVTKKGKMEAAANINSNTARSTLSMEYQLKDVGMGLASRFVIGIFK